ncbi:Uncharacterized protein PBTT_06063 [Plasmodiophora brassicae]
MVNRVLKMTAPCFSEIVGLLEAMNDDAVAFDAGAESRFTRIERRLSSGVISTSCILTPTTSAAVSRRASIVEPQTTMDGNLPTPSRRLSFGFDKHDDTSRQGVDSLNGESGQSRAAMDASEYIVKLETSLRSKTLQVEELRKSLEELQAKVWHSPPESVHEERTKEYEARISSLTSTVDILNVKLHDAEAWTEQVKREYDRRLKEAQNSERQMKHQTTAQLEKLVQTVFRDVSAVNETCKAVLAIVSDRPSVETSGQDTDVSVTSMTRLLHEMRNNMFPTIIALISRLRTNLNLSCMMLADAHAWTAALSYDRRLLEDRIRQTEEISTDLTSEVVRYLRECDDMKSRFDDERLVFRSTMQVMSLISNATGRKPSALPSSVYNGTSLASKQLPTLPDVSCPFPGIGDVAIESPISSRESVAQIPAIAQSESVARNESAKPDDAFLEGTNRTLQPNPVAMPPVLSNSDVGNVTPHLPLDTVGAVASTSDGIATASPRTTNSSVVIQHAAEAEFRVAPTLTSDVREYLPLERGGGVSMQTPFPVAAMGDLGSIVATERFNNIQEPSSPTMLRSNRDEAEPVLPGLSPVDDPSKAFNIAHLDANRKLPDEPHSSAEEVFPKPSGTAGFHDKHFFSSESAMPRHDTLSCEETIPPKKGIATLPPKDDSCKDSIRFGLDKDIKFLPVTGQRAGITENVEGHSVRRSPPSPSIARRKSRRAPKSLIRPPLPFVDEIVEEVGRRQALAQQRAHEEIRQAEIAARRVVAERRTHQRRQLIVIAIVFIFANFLVEKMCKALSIADAVCAAF